MNLVLEHGLLVPKLLLVSRKQNVTRKLNTIGYRHTEQQMLSLWLKKKQKNKTEQSWPCHVLQHVVVSASARSIHPGCSDGCAAECSRLCWMQSKQGADGMLWTGAARRDRLNQPPWHVPTEDYCSCGSSVFTADEIRTELLVEVVRLSSVHFLSISYFRLHFVNTIVYNANVLYGYMRDLLSTV